MKKLIITTAILLIATACLTVIYFRNLNPPGARTREVISAIPNTAALIFEFNNEQSFYDIFSGDTLLTSLTGSATLADMDTLRSLVLQNPQLAKYFNGQNLFISVHPVKNSIGLLFTITAADGFDISMIGGLAKQQNTGLIINPVTISGKQGYTIYITALKKHFFIIHKDDDIFSGSFSEELLQQSGEYKPSVSKSNFVLLPDQQNSNSLASLYVNSWQLSFLFDQLFKVKNTDILRSFRLLPSLAVLSLNYKTDALMFNGSTTIQYNEPVNYLSIFTFQQPVVNHLKGIFPSTTAYSTSFSVSDPSKFGKDLSYWHIKAGLKREDDALFMKIKAETGVNLKAEFNNLLGNEFAILTTRYQEKLAIISVKDGSKLLPFMANISSMANDNTGQFKYNKLPFFLLGDAFSTLHRPYFIILDNYLVLANSAKELASYNDTYINRKFINKTSQYNQFDELTAERSNVAFFIDLKNAQPIFKKEMNPAFFQYFENTPGWSNFYGASYQFSASDKGFYTNFCMQLNVPDTTGAGNNSNNIQK